MRYFSMFSGIGGFELGIGAEHTCVGYSEIDKYAIKVYERHFDGHTNYGDATRINPADLPDFELLVGGFPCQAFSIAGKRAGFDDTRGTLFFDIARIIKDKRPRHLVLENVKGLLSHEGGKTLQTIFGVLTDLGYDLEWQVLNSKNFGVPQNRERIFIVGHLRGQCSGKILPIAGQNGKSTQIVGRIDVNGHDYLKRVYSRDGASPTLPTKTGGGHIPKTAVVVSHGKLLEDTISKAVDASYYKGADNHGQRTLVKSAATRTRAYAGKPETLEVRPDDVSNTINSVPKDYYATDGISIRRLTPTECERLQGFPDGWTDSESDTQRYKMCGNAVTTNVVKAVMERLFEHENLLD